MNHYGIAFRPNTRLTCTFNKLKMHKQSLNIVCVNIYDVCLMVFKI